MTKLYVYTTVKGFQGSWDEALESGMVEIVATIEGKDQEIVEKKAHELYGDSDTYGWTYSADGIDYAEECEEIMNCIITETGSTDTLQKYWIAHDEQGCWAGRNEEEVMDQIAKNAGYKDTKDMDAVVGKNNITLEQISKAEYEEIDTIISELGIGQGEALSYLRSK